MSRIELLLKLLTLSLWASACAAPAPTVPTHISEATTAPAATSEPTRALTLPPTTSATPAPTSAPATLPLASPTLSPTGTPTPSPTPPSRFAIDYLRQQSFTGGDIAIEQTLAPGSNYSRYIASYSSSGFKIFALLTVPQGARPSPGWPVIIFNHGYISPRQYSSTESYVAYQDALARAGYITFKPDYRGSGQSEGSTSNAHLAPEYTIDVLNALAWLKNYPAADPKRIGMWGHSLGGDVTLRAMVVSKDIKAGVIWSGTVGSYNQEVSGRGGGGAGLGQQFGTPAQNPEFWASILATTYINDLSGPLQLHHSLADTEVAFKYSQQTYDQAKQAGRNAELYSYPGNDHNLANTFALAMQRTLAFFDQYLKGK